MKIITNDQTLINHFQIIKNMQTNSDETTQAAATEASTAASTTTTTTSARPEYTGDKGDFKNTFERNPAIEKKPVPQYAYGGRVRIAALHDDYEQFLDHLIQVGGWAKTTRMGGKEFMFIELSDGSCSKSLQVVVDATMPDFADIAASKVGASYKFKGKLIRSPKDGQPFEL